MKYIFIITGIGIVGYFFVKDILDKIKISFTLKNIDFSKLSINQKIDGTCIISIYNKNFFNITLKNIYAELFINNQKIGGTEAVIKEFKIKKETNNFLASKIYVTVNSTSVISSLNLLNGKNSGLYCLVYFKILGIKIKIKNIL